MRILNQERLTSHGNVQGRRALLEILEAGLEAADPYSNAVRLLRVEGGKLVVGHSDFEPRGLSNPGEEVFDLAHIGRIFVIGAAKGVQRVAKAFEDVLGSRLTGGHVIDKYGAEVILDKIGVTLGAHPVPDDNCVRGCEKILAICRDLHKDDLVFTIVGNGVSSLLTMPVPGVSLEDIRRTTYIMQIERGAPTEALNAVRNHLDVMKGGRISTYVQPAKAVHILAFDPGVYDQLLYRNYWLHSLPDYTTFQDAVAMLKRWNAWDDVPEAVRQYILEADPSQETLKAEQFKKLNHRVFGIMPLQMGMFPVARKKAEELGFKPYTLSRMLQAEASQAGAVVASIARTIERLGEPLEPPCALFTGGELLVTVGSETGVGGRNQEYALAAALGVAGSKNIVMAAVDTDGTDGPGPQLADQAYDIPTLAGGIIDGETAVEAKAAGVDIHQELRRHNTSPALWQLDSGILATHNISLLDLAVTLVLGRS